MIPYQRPHCSCYIPPARMTSLLEEKKRVEKENAPETKTKAQKLMTGLCTTILIRVTVDDPCADQIKHPVLRYKQPPCLITLRIIQVSS